MPLQVLPNSNWKSIFMDFIVKLLKTQRQKDTILVIIDIFNKMAHFIATQEILEALQIANLFIDHVFWLHGLPMSLVFDSGHFWSHFFGCLEVYLNMSSGDHPKTNGQTKRVN